MHRLRRDEYTVGWVCALAVELAAAQEMLDEEHETPRLEADDTNIYTCGRIGEHNVVIACLPEGQTGTNSAAAVAVQMKSAFPSTRFGLMVGIGGGVPSKEADIRLGDVVISKPHKVHGGVVQYDFGKTTPGGFERTGMLNTPPTVLLNAIANLRARQMRGKGRLSEYLSKLDSLPGFAREAAGPDTLFDATYGHAGGATCSQCNNSYVVAREPRRQEVMVHYGTIASGNQVMRSATERDNISADLGGVLCFEMEAAGLMNSFPCLVIRGICDYADSHKNKRWQPYAAGTAAACAKEVLSVMPPAEVVQTRKAGFVIASHEFLPMLYENTCIYEESKIRNRQRVPGTCEWFTNHTLFRQWISPANSQVSGLLYVTADPGCGKSVLSRYLIDEILPQTGRTVCYFFFKDDFEQQKSSLSALCSLLHQIFDTNSHLLTDEVLTGYVNRGKGFFESFENLWHTFLLATKNREIICVLDALDECRDKDRKQLIDAFATVCNITSTKTAQHGGPRFLLTSRPYEHIRAHFSIQLNTPVASIHLQGDQGPTADAIAEEIQLVLDSRINEAAKFFCLEPDEQALMRTQLGSVPNRTYLWITLVFDGLMKRKSGVSKSDIMNLLKQPPQSVYDVYEQILNKSPDIQDARRLLHIIIGAKRPLSLAEMSIALAFKNKHSVDSVPERIIPRSRIGTYVRGLCGLFAVIVDEKVYLLHQTAREFLIYDDAESPSRQIRHNFDEPNQNDSIQPCIWRHSLIIPNANAVLAEICILYLLSKVATQDSPLLEYAAVYWTIHYRQSSDGCQLDMAKMAKDLCMPSKQCSQWTAIYKHRDGVMLPSEPLSLASCIGSEKIVQMILFEQDYIGDSSENILGSQISPIRRRILQIKQSYRVIWDKEHRKNIREALWYAVENGHRAIVELLLQTKAGVNFKDSWHGRTPLLIAAVNGHSAIVELLIETTRAGVNSKYKDDGLTPLSHAARNGHEAVVRLLLDDRRIDVNSRDIKGLTPLSHAARNGHEAVVRLLLEDGRINVKSRDKDGRTPLLYAVFNGHEGVFKLLLEASQHHDDSENNYNGLALLCYAAENGHEGIVRLLLETGEVDVNVKCGYYDETPLSYAAKSGHEGVVRLLLETDEVEVDSKDRYDDRTPLSFAAESGHEGVVRLLLETGEVDVDSKDRYDNQTPLLYAAKRGHKGIVRLLLETGEVDVNVKGGYYDETPLSYAAKSGHEGVVGILLEVGDVNINSKDGRFSRTALSYAAERGHQGVVRLLLEASPASANLRDINDRTPLSYAIENKHEAVIKLLQSVGNL